MNGKRILSYVNFNHEDDQLIVKCVPVMREDIYIGITKNEFKTRYNQHTSSFRLSHKSSATSLSENILKLKENNTDHTVTWKILEKAQPYSPTTGKCNLCTSEKTYIYFLNTPFSEQVKRTLFNLPTQEKTTIKFEIRRKKKAPSRSAPSRSALRPPEKDGPKWPPVTGL